MSKQFTSTNQIFEVNTSENQNDTTLTSTIESFVRDNLYSLIAIPTRPVATWTRTLGRILGPLFDHSSESVWRPLYVKFHSFEPTYWNLLLKFEREVCLANVNYHPNSEQTWTNELLSPEDSTICSVSTKLATLPFLSIPRMKWRVPALRQLRRDTILQVKGFPFSEHELIDMTAIV